MTRSHVAAWFALGLCLLATGCGESTPRKQHEQRLVATLGDSITAGTPLWDPNEGVRLTEAGTGVDPRSQYQYWAARRHPELRFRNCGVNRERTDQIARRFAACVAGARELVIQGGINDIAQGYPPAVAAANIDAMVVRAKRMHLRVALAELLPWNNGDSTTDSEIRDLNTRIRAIASARGAIVLPFYKTLEDPERPGRMRWRWTAEGDHPSVAGYRRLGELAFRVP